MPCELSTGSDWHRKAISRRNESKRRDTAANCSRPTSRLRATHFYSSFNAPQFRSGSSPWPWACLAGARLACSLSLLCMVGADYWLAIAGSPACQGATIGTETKITPSRSCSGCDRLVCSPVPSDLQVSGPRLKKREGSPGMWPRANISRSTGLMLLYTPLVVDGRQLHTFSLIFSHSVNCSTCSGRRHAGPVAGGAI